MHVAIRQYKVKAGSMDELARRAQEGFVPLIRHSPGFVAYYGVVAGTDRVFTVSIFQDQAGADESNSIAADWVKQNVTSLVEGSPEITAGEVRWSSGPLSSL
jgi:heme-degrading monooxygenase HmoA